MNRLVVTIAIGLLAAALGALACGNSSDKPPLTPDMPVPAVMSYDAALSSKM